MVFGLERTAPWRNDRRQGGEGWSRRKTVVEHRARCQFQAATPLWLRCFFSRRGRFLVPEKVTLVHVKCSRRRGGERGPVGEGVSFAHKGGLHARGVGYTNHTTTRGMQAEPGRNEGDFGRVTASRGLFSRSSCSTPARLRDEL